MMTHRNFISLALLLGTSCWTAFGESSWPQWRGIHRDGLNNETGLLKQWPEGGPRQVWVFRDAGAGYSGPAIAGGRLYTMGARGDVEELICLDLASGKKVWSTPVGDKLKNRWGDGPRSTPAVQGGMVYAMGGEGGLICVRADTGAKVWETAMEKYRGRTPGWGYTESVLVDGPRVICTPGGRDGAVLALDKMTGKTLWQSSDFTERAHYSSVIRAKLGGVDQYVQLTEKQVVGLGLEDGAVLWTADFPGRTAVIPTPIAQGNRVFVTAGYGAGCRLLEIDSDQKVNEVYSNKNMKNHHGGVIQVGDHLYGYSDGVGWLCQNFDSGEIVWREKDALGKGAIGYADGMLYCLAENDGTLVLIDANPKGWNERGRFKLSPQSEIRSRSGKIWTHPVIVDGKLYLRDQDLVYCYELKP